MWLIHLCRRGAHCARMALLLSCTQCSLEVHPIESTADAALTPTYLPPISASPIHDLNETQSSTDPDSAGDALDMTATAGTLYPMRVPDPKTDDSVATEDMEAAPADSPVAGAGDTDSAAPTPRANAEQPQTDTSAPDNVDQSGTQDAENAMPDDDASANQNQSSNTNGRRRNRNTRTSDVTDEARSEDAAQGDEDNGADALEPDAEDDLEENEEEAEEDDEAAPIEAEALDDPQDAGTVTDGGDAGEPQDAATLFDLDAGLLSLWGDGGLDGATGDESENAAVEQVAPGDAGTLDDDWLWDGGSAWRQLLLGDIL